MNLIIPAEEIKVSFARSQGKGGQKVNKTSTKVFLHWDVYNSHVLTPEQKYKIIHVLANRINEKGELVLWSQTERTQTQNKNKVINKLYDLIEKVLTPEKKRLPTKPSKAAKEKRLQQKKKVSAKKKLRQKVDY